MLLENRVVQMEAGQWELEPGGLWLHAGTGTFVSDEDGFRGHSKNRQRQAWRWRRKVYRKCTGRRLKMKESEGREKAGGPKKVAYR